MYRDIPISQRLDKIGELLAKGAYLYLKNENPSVKKQRDESTNEDIRSKADLPKKLRKSKISS